MKQHVRLAPPVLRVCPFGLSLAGELGGLASGACSGFSAGPGFRGAPGTFRARRAVGAQRAQHSRRSWRTQVTQETQETAATSYDPVVPEGYQKMLLKPSKKTLGEALEWIDALPVYDRNERDAFKIRRTRRQSLIAMASLSEGAGGILVVAPSELLQRLGKDGKTQYSDGGEIMQCCALRAGLKQQKDISVNDDECFPLLAATYAHYDKDRNVRNMSLDGGVCVSDRSGTVQGCAVVFRGLRVGDVAFEGAGAKHAAAVDLAYTLRQGIILVRSETGRVRIINADALSQWNRSSYDDCCVDTQCSIELECGAMQHNTTDEDMVVARQLCEGVLAPVRKAPVPPALEERDRQELEMLSRITARLVAGAHASSKQCSATPSPSLGGTTFEPVLSLGLANSQAADLEPSAEMARQRGYFAIRPQCVA